MVHLSLAPETMDKLAASAVLHGHSMTDEIRYRIERSFKPVQVITIRRAD